MSKQEQYNYDQHIVEAIKMACKEHDQIDLSEPLINLLDQKAFSALSQENLDNLLKIILEGIN